MTEACKALVNRTTEPISRQDLDLPPMALREGEVSVWVTRLDPEADSVEQLRQMLDDRELERASRFRFAKDRSAFIVARGTLRMLLGRYLGERPQRVRFEYGPHGKPALDSNWSMQRLYFNLSHADHVAVFAFTSSAELGIDVERVRPLEDIDEIAERFFSREEVVALSRVSAHREKAFFACWTAKEAYIKGIGDGLSMPLERFAVSLGPKEGAIRLRILDGDAAAPPWRLHRFEPYRGFIAAVAVQARRFRLKTSFLPLEAMTR